MRGRRVLTACLPSLPSLTLFLPLRHLPSSRHIGIHFPRSRSSVISPSRPTHCHSSIIYFLRSQSVSSPSLSLLVTHPHNSISYFIRPQSYVSPLLIISAYFISSVLFPPSSVIPNASLPTSVYQTCTHFLHPQFIIFRPLVSWAHITTVLFPHLSSLGQSHNFQILYRPPPIPS